MYATISALSSTALFGSGFGDFIGLEAERPGRSRHRHRTSATPIFSRSAIAKRKVGLDLGFLNSRADLSFTYYNKRSTDVILPAPVNAASTGAQTGLVNGATITNKGVELVANLRPYHVAEHRLHDRRQLRAQPWPRRVAHRRRAIHPVQQRRIHRRDRLVDGRLRAGRDSRSGLGSLRLGQSITDRQRGNAGERRRGVRHEREEGRALPRRRMASRSSIRTSR